MEDSYPASGQAKTVRDIDMRWMGAHNESRRILPDKREQKKSGSDVG